MYSQKDPAYKNKKLGTCKDSISQSGCFLVSFCNLLKELRIGEITPPDFNKRAYPNGGCMANASYWAGLYSMSYQKTTARPKTTCIFETNYYKPKGVPQHFCVIRSDGMIADPLDYPVVWKKNKYPIVSYRVFTPKAENPPVTTPTPSNVSTTATTPIQVNFEPPTPITGTGYTINNMETPTPEKQQLQAPKDWIDKLVELIIKFITKLFK